MSLKVKHGFHSEPLSQKINEEELEATGFVGKKEIDDLDCCSTLAHAGDYRNKSCARKRTIESSFPPRRSDKMEKSHEAVVHSGKEQPFNNTDQKWSSVLQFRYVKREESDDNFSTMVQFDTSPPASTNPNSSFKKSKSEITSHQKATVNIDNAVFDCDSRSSVTDIVIISSSDDEAYTSPLKVPKVNNKLRGTMESNKNKMTITGLPGLDQSSDLDMTRNIFDLDRCSTVAHVGDYKRKSCTDKRTIESTLPPRRFDKLDKLKETVVHAEKELPFNVTDHKSASANSQLRLVKKEESNDVPGRHSSLPARGSVVRSSSDAVVPTSPLEVPKVKTKPRGMIESTKEKLTISVTTELDASADLAMNNSGINERSVWDLDYESEDNQDDRSSDKDCNDGGSGMRFNHSDMDVEEITAGDSSGSSKKDKLTCLDCPAVFETKKAFKLHIASHEGYRRFKCDVCEKRFIQSCHLNGHMLTHTGERPFRCNVCDKRFSLNGDLKKHIRIHTGERPFKCNVCEMRFSQSGSLQTHKRLHTGEKPFKCEVCKTRFTQSAHLNTHIRVHTGEKPFECDVCKMRFSQSGTLYNHKRIHTGEKPFECDVCKMRFSRIVYLKMHTRKHTGVDNQHLPDASQDCMDQPSTLASHSLTSDYVDDQKIRFRTKPIDYIIEKMATKNSNVVYLVWSKKFTMDLASAVARSGYNCLLCVKKFLPASFPDALNLSNIIQTSLIEIGPNDMKLRLFSFGGMVIPEKIGRHGRSKSLTKLESKLTKFSLSQGMKLVNIFKHAENKNGWYESLRRGLKEDCIITDTF